MRQFRGQLLHVEKRYVAMEKTRCHGYEPVGMKLEDLISTTRIGDPGLEEISTRRGAGGGGDGPPPGGCPPPVVGGRGAGAGAPCCPLPAWDRESSLVWVSPLWLNISIGIDSSPFPVGGDTNRSTCYLPPIKGWKRVFPSAETKDGGSQNDMYKFTKTQNEDRNLCFGSKDSGWCLTCS